MFGDDNDDEDVGFSINKGYADKYNKWRRAEELQKLKDRYGDVESDSSPSESEDEEGEALTSHLEKGWLKALAALKNKDPKIYQKDVRFYSSEESSEEAEDGKSKKKEKTKPVYLKDYERKLMLEKHQQDESSDSDSGVEAAGETSKSGYFEKQEEIKKSLLDAVDQSEDSDSDLLQHRSKTTEEKEAEEAEYVKWLKGHKKSLKKDKQIGVELEPLREYWNNPELDEREKFLKDFILNKRYKEKDSDRIPTYSEIVDEDEDLTEDEEDIDAQEKFERRFNFRFEEPGAVEIKSFPRSINDSVRRKDTKRSEQRQKKKERMNEEKIHRQEELKQLKKLKRQEIEHKIDQLREITGNKDIGFNPTDLEGDFDPAEHDRMMQQYFSGDYYAEEEGEKPEYDLGDEDLNPENWDEWAGQEPANQEQGDGQPHADDPGFVMDADYDPSQDTKSSKKKKKKKGKLAKALTKKKPVFDPDDKTFEEYVEEYYKLDYEDIAGDVPCRFKYRKVFANNFGLDVGEILKCPDKELNAWVSVKKMSQFRSEDDEQRDLQVYKKKAAMGRKTTVLTSLHDSEKTEEEGDQPDGQRAKKKKKKKRRGRKNSESTTETTTSTNPEQGHKKQGQGDSKQGEGNKKQVQGDNKQGQGESKQGQGHQSKGQSSPGQAGAKPDKKRKLKTENTDIDEASQKKQKLDDQQEVKSDKDSQTANKKKKRKKKKKNKDKDGGVGGEKTVNTANSGAVNKSESEKTVKDNPNKKKNKKKGVKKNFGMSDERLKAYGIDPKKMRFMKTDNFKGNKS